MTLAERLRKLRTERDWTQYAAAKASQMSQATFAKIESGRSENPGMDVLRRLSAGFQVAVDDLVAETVIPYGADHDAGRAGRVTLHLRAIPAGSSDSRPKLPGP